MHVARERTYDVLHYKWREGKPHVSSLVSLVVGEDVEVRDSWDGIPIVYYVYPRQKDTVRYSFSKTPSMMKYFSESIGYRNPWEKYAQTVVADFIYGGMETVIEQPDCRLRRAARDAVKNIEQTSTVPIH